MTTPSSGKAPRPPPLAHKPPSKVSARSWSRDFALRGLYQFLLTAGQASYIHEQSREQYQFRYANVAFYEALLEGVMREHDVLCGLLQPHLDRPWEHVSCIEQGILLLSAWELRFELGAPYRVVLHEAMELANRYASEDSYRYINAVLDPLAASLRVGEYAIPLTAAAPAASPLAPSP